MNRYTICIDAEHRIIYTDELPESDTLSYLQSKVGGKIELAGCIDGFNADLFVNEEGLLEAPKAFFLMPGVGQGWFAGNGVIAGVNEDGETVGTNISIDEVASRIEFATPFQMQRVLDRAGFEL